MRVAVLALQGAFIEHEQVLQRLGVETFQVRQLSDWQQPKDGLVLPGGESTVQMRLLRQLGLFAPIQQTIETGLPVFGTCAGMILLVLHTLQRRCRLKWKSWRRLMGESLPCDRRIGLPPLFTQSWMMIVAFTIFFLI